MNWARGPPIGRGSSAAVYLATSAAGDLFAVKSTDVSCSVSLQNEHCMISQLCSPHIVKSFGFDTTFENSKTNYNLFLEYIPGGTISEQIAKQGGSLDEGLIQFYAHQILLGLNYLHLNGIVHCDIKTQNILICEDGGLKIADFGCAKWAESSPYSKKTFAGTPAYMAPEVARGEEQSFAADIWALGCTVIEMATGSNPWPDMKDPTSALYRIANSDDVPEIPSWFSDSGKDFLGKCLTRDRKKRPTASELLKHEFLRENCGEIKKLNRESPTSVVDQGFWDSLEVSDSSTHEMGISSTSRSPANRVKDLIGDGSNFRFSDLPAEDDWMTVRGSAEIEDSSTSVSQYSDEDLMVSESNTFWDVSDEDLQASIVFEDSSFDYLDDVIDTIPVMDSDDTDIDVSVISKRILVESFSNQDRLFLPSSILLLASLSVFYKKTALTYEL